MSFWLTLESGVAKCYRGSACGNMHALIVTLVVFVVVGSRSHSLSELQNSVNQMA